MRSNRSTTSLLTLVLALTVFAAPLAAQVALGPPESVSIHVAGHDLLMIEGVQIGGRVMRVYLAGSQDGTWQVTSLEPMEDGLLPRNLVLDAARLSVDETGALRIEDVFLDKRFFAGTIRFNESYEQVTSYEFQATPPPRVTDNPLVAQLAEVYGIGSEENGEGPQPAPDADAGPGAESETESEPETEPESAPAPESVGETETEIEPEPAPSAEPAGDATSPAPQPVTAPTAAVIERAVSRILNRVDAVQAAGAQRIDALESTLERRAAALELRMDALEGRGSAIVTRLDALDERGAEIATRLAAIEADARAAGELLDRVARAPAGSPPAVASGDAAVDTLAPTLSLARARAAFSQSQLLDPAEGRVVRGTWRFPEAGRTLQDDPAERFGKLELRYAQDSRPVLYRMIGRARDSGWAGLGLHIAVNAVERPAGYGHGRSILVWLTRDAEVYGTDATFLEVYVSYDDVTMNRVAQAAVDSRLADPHALELLFDPAAGILTAAVNGVEYLRYRLNVPQGASMELALRGLGRVELSDVEARTRR